MVDHITVPPAAPFAGRPLRPPVLVAILAGLVRKNQVLPRISRIGADKSGGAPLGTPNAKLGAAQLNQRVCTAN